MSDNTLQLSELRDKHKKELQEIASREAEKVRDETERFHADVTSHYQEQVMTFLANAPIETRSCFWMLANYLSKNVEQETHLSSDGLVGALYNTARNFALRCLETEARNVLRANPDLDEFILAMGTWTWEAKDGHRVDCSEERFQSVNDILEEWDNLLGLSGEGVRFTADGPRVTHW